MKNTIKRTSVFVSREIQGRILLRLLKYWLFYNLAVWHALLLIDFQRYGIPDMVGHGPRLSLFEFYAEFTAQHVSFLVLSAVLSPIVLWDMLKLTHQIAGPLVRVRNTLNKMALGEPVSKITIRKDDLLTELRDAFNEFLDSHRLLVDQPQRSTGDSTVDNPESAILLAASKLQTDVASSDGSQSASAKATPIDWTNCDQVG